jgi:hypothetical protein
MLLALWSAYGFQQGGTTTQPSKGGISEYDYKKYRKYLTELQRVTEKRDERLYKKAVITASKKLEKAPDLIVNKVADVVLPSVALPEIDYRKLSLDLQYIIVYIDNQIKALMEQRQQDQFEEEFLLLTAI